LPGRYFNPQGACAFPLRTKNIQIGLSPLQNKYPPSFANVLLQSLASGNTLAFNSKARDLISLGYKHEISSHDWWAYLIVSDNGGSVIYDQVPLLRYRQHEANVVGSNKYIKAKLMRFILLIKGIYKIKIDQNINILLHNNFLLLTSNSLILKEFIVARKSINIIKIF
jgi:hypothetical protein